MNAAEQAWADRLRAVTHPRPTRDVALLVAELQRFPAGIHLRELGRLARWEAGTPENLEEAAGGAWALGLIARVRRNTYAPLEPGSRPVPVRVLFQHGELDLACGRNTWPLGLRATPGMAAALEEAMRGATAVRFRGTPILQGGFRAVLDAALDD